MSPATKIVLPAKRNRRSNQDASSRNFDGNSGREPDICDPEFRFDVKKHTYFPKSVQRYQETTGIWAVKPGYRWLYDDGSSEEISKGFRKADAAFEERKMERAAMGIEMSPIPMLEEDPSNMDASLQQVWYHP